MKYSILLGLIISALSLSESQCNKDLGGGSFKGRLEVKGICMNYTIKILEGKIDTSQVQALWTDPSTNKVHENVFGLANDCSFPSDINEGDEFYFSIKSQGDQDCATCMAYYPTPEKKLYIRVSKTPL